MSVSVRLIPSMCLMCCRDSAANGGGAGGPAGAAASLLKTWCRRHQSGESLAQIRRVARLPTGALPGRTRRAVWVGASPPVPS